MACAPNLVDPGFIEAASPSPPRRGALSTARMSKLHLVFGGRVSNPQGLDFTDSKSLEVVGIFPDYASAHKAWRGAAQRTVDDAEMKFVVVHLHRLLEPTLEG